MKFEKRGEEGTGVFCEVFCNFILGSLSAQILALMSVHDTLLCSTHGSNSAHALSRLWIFPL
jgi:hypothetical protein